MDHVLTHEQSHHDHHEDHESIKIDGFWIFLVSDVLLFGTLFATFVVLRTNYAGGPTGKDLFDVQGFIIETFVLLTSSFTSGLATLEMHKNRVKPMIAWLVITILLGLTFIYYEVNEFTHLATEGATYSRSAFLSAFFTLVGTHGCHVSLGILWMIAIMIQVGRHGLTAITRRKLFIVGLYWHFLDAVWIFLFTVVYLIGVM
jgi:cytochrome o ubiquinol oxidase subunit III